MKTSANIIRLEVPGLPPPATDGAWDVSHMALPRHQTEMIRHFLFNTVAIAFDLDPYQLERPGRGRARAALARQVAMYLAHVACGLSLTAVGSVFGRERSTVAHACRQIEEAREKEPFDHIVGMLERSVRTIIKTSRLLQTELEQARRGGRVMVERRPFEQPKDNPGPLTWLHQRRDKSGQPLISAEEKEAGERLAADFHAAMLNPRVTASWTGERASKRQRRGPPGFAMEPADRVIGAKQRFEAALRAVGRDHANLLVDICCFEKGLTQVEMSAGWPRRSGKLVLQFALRQLARHYGLIRDNQGPAPGEGPVRHWGGDDYRPEM